jgi:hypothetical protein
MIIELMYEESMIYYCLISEGEIMNNIQDKPDEKINNSNVQPDPPDGEQQSHAKAEAKSVGEVKQEDTTTYVLGYYIGYGVRLVVGMINAAIAGLIVGYLARYMYASSGSETENIVIYLICAVPLVEVLPVAKGALGKVLAVATYIIVFFLSSGMPLP